MTPRRPTIFTGAKPDSRIVKEEIFGPVSVNFFWPLAFAYCLIKVVVVIKFKDEEDLLKQANDTVYGLAAAVFSRDISRAINVAHKLQAGTVWVNCYNQLYVFKLLYLDPLNHVFCLSHSNVRRFGSFVDKH